MSCGYLANGPLYLVSFAEGLRGNLADFFSKQVHCRIRMGSMKTSAQQLGRRDVFFFVEATFPPKNITHDSYPQPNPVLGIYRTLQFTLFFLKPNGRSFLLPFLRLSLFGTTTVVLTDMLGVKLQWCPLWSLGSGADLVNWQWATMEIHRKKIPWNGKLGGGFKYFLFSTLFGEDSHFD